MREIKFKIWDKKFGHFVDADDTRLNPANGNICGKLSNGHVPDWVILQYTGLKDKNNIDLYYGDIIDHNGDRYVIDWVAPEFVLTFLGHPVESHHMWIDFDEETSCHFECIGNIHETPELLKD